MWTIINESGKVLYCKFDNEVIEGEIAIEMILIENFKSPYWDFENEIFYDKFES